MGEIESQRLERVVLQKHLSAKLAFATSFPSLSPSRNCPTISATLASALFLLWHLYFCIKSRGSFEFNFIFLFGNLLGTGGNWWFIIFRHLQSFPHEHKQLMWSVCLCFFWFGRYFSLYSSIYLPPHPTPPQLFPFLFSKMITLKLFLKVSKLYWGWQVKVVWKKGKLWNIACKVEG